MLTHDYLTALEERLSFNAYQSYADASVLIAITKETQPKILLTKRASHLNKHAGEVSFPGGKREPNDTDDIGVALRETAEEIGLIPSSVELLGELAVQTSKYGLSVKPIVGFIPVNSPLVAEPNEIERIFFVDLAELLTAEFMPYQITYAGQQLRVPSFQLEGEIIWGLTAKMLVDLMQQVFDYQKQWKMVM